MSSANEEIPSETMPQMCQLPNGMAIYHVNKPETDFLYKEIFLERAYLKHGIELGPDACVFDVGANIGMFTLFTKQECPGATVFAFEPTPELRRIATLNTARFGDSVRVYQNGLADQDGEADFTYYPDYSIMSGFGVDPAKDAGVLSSGIRNQLARGRTRATEIPDEFINHLVEKKLGRKSQIKCRLKTISRVVSEANVGKIDLLKIDAERSELPILKGIGDQDWAKIKQVVLEVHSVEETEIIIPLLERRGFRIKVEQEGQFVNSCVFNIFARQV